MLPLFAAFCAAKLNIFSKLTAIAGEKVLTINGKRGEAICFNEQYGLY